MMISLQSLELRINVVNIKLARVERSVTQSLCSLIPSAIKDPRAHLAEALSVTKVKLSPDLTLARVLISIKADENVQYEVFDAIERAGGFLRRELGKRVKMRRIPELVFQLDHTAEKVERIEEILRELADERQEKDDKGDDAGS